MEQINETLAGLMAPEQAAAAPEAGEPAKIAETAKKRARRTKTAEDTKEAEKAVESKNTEKQDDDFVNNHLPWESPLDDCEIERKMTAQVEAHKGGCFTDAPAAEIKVDTEAEKRAIVADAAKVGLLQTEIEF